MASFFFDSSALVKLYHVEAGSAVVDSLLRGADSRIVISRLTVVELVSAFAVKQRTQMLTAKDAEAGRLRFLYDVANGRLTVITVREPHYLTAQRLIIGYGGTKGVRALDAIQLGVALDVKNLGVSVFVAADRTLMEIARSEGLSVLNPEDP
ncbi:MAG: type II toxin-antitoxin system VapC family toxin [Acidobacteriia bacterium]|nr:type II toxin-antitoxin system VapC family toxin [Terriglobia bacterium]